MSERTFQSLTWTPLFTFSRKKCSTHNPDIDLIAVCSLYTEHLLNVIMNATIAKDIRWTTITTKSWRTFGQPQTPFLLWNHHVQNRIKSKHTAHLPTPRYQSPFLKFDLKTKYHNHWFVVNVVIFYGLVIFDLFNDYMIYM